MTAAPLNCEVLAMGARWRPPLGVGVPVVVTVKEKGDRMPVDADAGLVIAGGWTGRVLV